MKNIALILVSALLLLVLAGCDVQSPNTAEVNDPQDNNGENTENTEAPSAKSEGFVMTAVVKNIGEKLEVDVISAEYASGVFHIIISESSLIYSANGKQITKADLKPDDIVEITYNGQVMLSYPPQVVAHKIVVK